MGIAAVGAQFAFEQGIATSIAMATCKDTETQTKEQCMKDAAAQKNATADSYAHSLVGIIGGELLEKFLKKALTKQTAKIAAKTAAKAASKGASKSAAKVGTKLGSKMARIIAKLTIKLLRKIGTKIAMKIAAKIAAKLAAGMAARVAVKAAMGPVGWVLLIFDLISLGLDLWDPFNFNETFYNKDLREIRQQFLDGYTKAIDEAALPKGYKDLLYSYHFQIENYKMETRRKERIAKARGETYVDNDEFSVAKQPWYEDMLKINYSKIASMKNKELPASMGGPIKFPFENHPDYPHYIKISTDFAKQWFKDNNLTDVYSDDWYNSETYTKWQKAIDEARSKGVYANRCLEPSDRAVNSDVKAMPCGDMSEGQKFEYTAAGQLKLKGTDLCLEVKDNKVTIAGKEMNEVMLSPCETTRMMPGSTDDDPQFQTRHDFKQRWAFTDNNRLMSMKKSEGLNFLNDETGRVQRNEAKSDRMCLSLAPMTKEQENSRNLVIRSRTLAAEACTTEKSHNTNLHQQFEMGAEKIKSYETGSEIPMPKEYRDLQDILKGFNMTQATFEQDLTTMMIKDPVVRQMWIDETKNYINQLFTEERIDEIVQSILDKHDLPDMEFIYADGEDPTKLTDNEAMDAEDGEDIGGDWMVSTDEGTGCRYRYHTIDDLQEYLKGPDGGDQKISRVDPGTGCPIVYNCETGVQDWGSPDGSDHWLEKTNNDGKIYYYNCTNGESSWHPNGIDPNLNTWVDGVDEKSQCAYRYNPSQDLTEIKKGPDGTDQIKTLRTDVGCDYTYNCNTGEIGWPDGPEQWVTQGEGDDMFYYNCQSQETSWFPNGVAPEVAVEEVVTNKVDEAGEPVVVKNPVGKELPPAIKPAPIKTVEIKPKATELALPPKQEPEPTPVVERPPLPKKEPPKKEDLVPKEVIEFKEEIKKEEVRMAKIEQKKKELEERPQFVQFFAPADENKEESSVNLFRVGIVLIVIFAICAIIGYIVFGNKGPKRMRIPGRLRRPGMRRNPGARMVRR